MRATGPRKNRAARLQQNNSPRARASRFCPTVCPTQAAKTQVFEGDRVLEIGCDLGATTDFLVRRGAAEVLAVDKAKDRLATARARVVGATFLACDVLAAPAAVEAAMSRADVVFVDINGSREYAAVTECVSWVEARWPDAVVVVKSVAYMQRHFPESMNAHAPRRQRPPPEGRGSGAPSS